MSFILVYLFVENYLTKVPAPEGCVTDLEQIRQLTHYLSPGCQQSVRQCTSSYNRK